LTYIILNAKKKIGQKYLSLIKPAPSIIWWKVQDLLFEFFIL
jgi:hypothetical protein